MQPLFNAQKGKMFNGTTASDNAERQLRKRRRAQELNKQRLEDKEFLKRTILRASRIKKLEDLVQDQPSGSVPMILDGVADDNVNIYNHKPTALLASPAEDANAPKMIQGAEAGANRDPHNDVGAGTPSTLPSEHDSSSRHGGESLNTTRGCYICKRRFKVLHHFYDTLCESCAALNWSKRMQFCDMTGRVCLVTGGRVKIGFQCCLKLLRAGAVVIATSRFPADTSLRYAAQHDFHSWKDRLHVFGIDLRDLAAIEELCTYLQKNFPWIDAVINNVSCAHNFDVTNTFSFVFRNRLVRRFVALPCTTRMYWKQNGVWRLSIFELIEMAIEIRHSHRLTCRFCRRTGNIAPSVGKPKRLSPCPPLQVRELLRARLK
jgi:hypothetical protein